MQILAIISASVVLCTSHGLCLLVESRWWQAPEGTAEASSQTGDKHGQLLLPLLYVQHKWWNLRQISYAVESCITAQFKKRLNYLSICLLVPLLLYLVTVQRLWTRVTQLIWMPSWLTCAPLNRSSTPFPNQTLLLAATTKDNSEPLGATVPVPSTQAPVEGGAVEVQNNVWICRTAKVVCKSQFLWGKIPNVI